MSYVHLFEEFAFIERDADSNLLYCIAYMVIMNAKASEWSMVRTKVVATLVDVALSWYTNQTRGHHLVYPPDPLVRPRPTEERDPEHPGQMRTKVWQVEDTSAYRHKKGVTLLQHLRALMRHDAGKEYITTQPRVFEHVTNLLNIFCGMQPQRRELDQHVEYEVEWTKSFSHLTELARFANDLGKCVVGQSEDNAVERMSLVIGRIWADLSCKSEILGPRGWQPPQTPHVEPDILFVGSRTEMIAFDTLTITHFSFHEYLHLLLAEMVKSFRTIGPAAREQPGQQDWTLAQMFDVLLEQTESGPEDLHFFKLALFEAPIRSTSPHTICMHGQG